MKRKKIQYGNGNVTLDDYHLLVALEIKFRGKFNPKGILKGCNEQDKLFYMNNRKLIITTLNLATLPSIVFKYEGTLKITKCIGVDKKNIKHNLYIKNIGLDFWNEADYTWNTGGQWNKRDSNYLVGNKVYEHKKILPKIPKDLQKTLNKL